MEIHNKLRIQTTLSVIITVIGFVLLIFMVTVESEPGLIPLLLITLGTAWFFFTRYKIRSKTDIH